jgi:hypothetical protein
MTKGPLDLVREVAQIFDDLDIPYALGGSMASSLFGEPRSTVDVDIAIMLAPDQESQLLERAAAEFYVPESAARTAMLAHRSFNLIDVPNALKVDLFVLGDELLDQMQIERRVNVTIPGIEGGIWVTAPEVQVLRKLDWYREGGSVSDRQWRDVVGILRSAGPLDTEYLLEAAGQIGLEALVARAIVQATT